MAATVEIRQFLPDDVASYRQIRLRSLQTDPDAFLAQASEFEQRPDSQIAMRLRRSYELKDNIIVGAFSAGEPVAMSSLYYRPPPKRQHIAFVYAVYVEPEWRGLGIGGRLLDRIIAQARRSETIEQLQLTVNSDNQAAVALYLSRGFRRYGREPQAVSWQGRYFDHDLMHLPL